MIEEKNLESGTVINGFKILEEIDCGPFWTVYRAFQINLERQVALKVLSAKLSDDTNFVGRFFNKARIAANLSHPGIVQIYDAGVSDSGIYYIASEIIEGETLDHKIKKEGHIKKILYSMKIALAIAEALDYAWEKQSLVHGDLKPENIIMNGSSSARIADFGLLKYQTEEDRKAGMEGPFTAPELRSGTNPSFTTCSDMYSFGALLYYMVAGQPPSMHKRKALAVLNKEVKPNLAAFVDKLLSADIAARPASWSDVIHKLESLINLREKVHPLEVQTNDSVIAPAPEIKVPEKEKDDALEKTGTQAENQRKKRIVPPLWSMIIGGLAIIAILLGTLIFVLRGKASPPPNESVQKKWMLLKDDIQFLNIDEAITRVDNFIAQNGNQTPKEALEKLNEMKKQEQQSRQSKDYREKFRTRLASLENILQKTAIERESTQKLETIRREIWGIYGDAKKYSIPEIIFNSRSKKTLNENLNKINTILKARTPPAQPKPAAPATPVQTAAKPAPQPATAPPPAAKPATPATDPNQERNQTNRMIDEYYTMLDSALSDNQEQAKKVEAFKKSLAAWQKKYGPRTNSIWGRKAELFLEILSSSMPLNEFFQNSQELLKGKTLPVKKYPEGYLVDSVDQGNIKLAKNDGKAILGKKISLNSLSDDELTLIIGTVMLPGKKSDSLTPEQMASILVFLARAGKSSEIKALPAHAKWSKAPNIYQELVNDLGTARLEAKAISQLKVIYESMKDKNPYKAANATMIITTECADTSFARRYAPEIKNFSNRFDRVTPTILAERFFADNTTGVQEKDKVLQNLTAYNRFGALDAENPAIKTKIDALKKNFSMLPGRNMEFADNDKALPFMHWAKAVPGEVRTYQVYLQKKNQLRKEDSIYKLFSIGAALDSFNWKAVNNLYDKDVNYKAIFSENSRNKKYAPYLIFAGSYASERLGDGRATRKNIDSLEDAMSTAQDGESKTAACILLMEYAIMTDFPETAIAAAGKFDFDNSVEIEDFKIKLLNIYAMLESPKTDRPSIAKAIQALAAKYSDKPDFKNDTAWCNAALKILNGCPEKDKKQLTDALKPLECYAPDICARIVTCAFARNQYENQNVYIDRKFAGEIADLTTSKVSPTTASSELWEKSALIRLAGATSLHELEAGIKKLFGDYNPASIKSYSFLCFLYAGIDALKNKASKESTAALLSAFFKASPAASDSDIKAATIAQKASPRDLLFELMTDKDTEGAFNASILGIMVFQGQERMNIYATMSELEKNISFEKKLLLKSLGKYIK